MCEYEKTCVEKPVPGIIRRNHLIKESTVCENDPVYCETHRFRRLCARSHAISYIGQVRITSY